ncbi:hypothetical protein GCM10010319_58270 [Streptomyces blastmyceticus]|uniref:Uncharacterized protein n=1 Tax=Streptomyces blastmyceticus TaxID=68180 RepID=A0ABN0XTK3_9ACTN
MCDLGASVGCYGLVQPVAARRSADTGGGRTLERWAPFSLGDSVDPPFLAERDTERSEAPDRQAGKGGTGERAQRGAVSGRPCVGTVASGSGRAGPAAWLPGLVGEARRLCGHGQASDSASDVCAAASRTRSRRP